MYNVHILSLNWIKFFQNCQSQETEQEEQRRLLHNINNQIRASLLNISQQIHAQKEAKNRENMETHFTQINNADEEHINYEKVYWQNASNFFLNLYIQYMYLKRNQLLLYRGEKSPIIPLIDWTNWGFMGVVPHTT